jgi:arylsulfatase A-like enzyme
MRPIHLFAILSALSGGASVLPVEGSDLAAEGSTLPAEGSSLPAEGSSLPAEGSSQDARPNIVLIYADDHAERAIGAYGSSFANTPNIDRLAAEGMRFTQSFVANSICGPCRAILLTGLHSHANGKQTNRGGFKNDLPTWATTMQSAGYQTAMVGKWHLSPNPRGFDHWAIAKGGYYNPAFVTAEGKQPQQGYTTEVITREALRWIEERDPEKPFIAWISHAATHRTWQPSPEHLDHYDEVTIPEPATLFDDYEGRTPAAVAAQMRIARDLFPAYDLKLPVTGDGILDGAAKGRLSSLTPEERAAWDAAYDPKNEAFFAAELEGDDLVRWKYQRYMKDYLRCVDAIDDSVGEVLAYLEESGLADNTIVIYSSDQGFFLGEHGWYDKRWMYEPALRTPLIVRWPGATEPGSVSDSMVQNIDMAPTFMALANVEEPPVMHGESLLPLLRGETPNDWRDSIYYHYFQADTGRTTHTVAPHFGVRTQRHKLIYVIEHDAYELYDLERDPEELNNVFDAATHAEARKDMLERLEASREHFGDETR